MYSTVNLGIEKVPNTKLKNTKFNNNHLLHPWFITGFSVAESSFSINVYPDKRSKLKWNVSLLFSINLHIKDIAILELIKKN